MNKLLVVEDDPNTSEMLRRYFEIVGYDVVNASTGGDAVEMAKDTQPAVIILDIILPDMDGYEVCKKLRSEESTDHIPIIFLTQKDERRDRLDGLSLGADDYITKPFDMDELRLRVHNIIDRLSGVSLVDARTGLPSKTLIKERLPQLLANLDSGYLDVQIDHLESFRKKYGPVATNQVIRSAAKIIADVLHQIDPIHSFLGHPTDNNFLVAVRSEDAIKKLEKELPERFAIQAEKFYDDGPAKEQSPSNYQKIKFSVKPVDKQAVQKHFGIEESESKELTTKPAKHQKTKSDKKEKPSIQNKKP